MSTGPEMVTGIVTSLVTPFMVKLPVMAVGVNFMLTKVMAGNLAASKKSGLFKCASRLAMWVLILETSIVIFALELAKSVGLYIICPSNLSNSPGTLLIIMCLTTKVKDV